MAGVICPNPISNSSYTLFLSHDYIYNGNDFIGKKAFLASETQMK